jgi:uncharacterized membrane protein
MNEPETEQTVAAAEIAISNLLRVGVLLSAAVILAGLLLLLATGRSGYAAGFYPTAPAAILRGAAAGKPYAVILSGLLLLILTPALRVAVSILLFLRQKDYLYAGITAAVLAVLAISFALGKIV